MGIVRTNEKAFESIRKKLRVPMKRLANDFGIEPCNLSRMIHGKMPGKLMIEFLDWMGYDVALYYVKKKPVLPAQVAEQEARERRQKEEMKEFFANESTAVVTDLFLKKKAEIDDLVCLDAAERDWLIEKYMEIYHIGAYGDKRTK